MNEIQKYSTTSLYAQELESLVIGSLLSDTNAAKVVFEAISSDCFTKDLTLAQTIEQMYKERKPIDLLTVHQKIKEIGLSYDASYLTQLCTKVGSTANLEYHCRIIAQKAIARRLIEINQSAIKDLLFGSDVFEVMDKMRDTIENNVPESNANTFHIQDINAKEVLRETIKHGYKSIKFGLQDNDGKEIEFEYSSIVILAAEPSVGKTAISLNLLIRACARGHSVGFFNFESSVMSLKRRLLAMETGIGSGRIKRGLLSEQEADKVYKSSGFIDGFEIYMNEKDNNIYSLCNAIRKLCTLGVKLFFVDNMTNVNLPEGDRLDVRIGEFLKPLAALKKELDICIVLITHLARDRTKALLQRLRNSGEYENHGDLIIFLERDIENSPQFLEVFAAKNRDDALWKATLSYDVTNQKIDNCVNYEFPEITDYSEPKF